MPNSPYISHGLQHRFHQRQSDVDQPATSQMSRGSFMTNHETDFLMASIMGAADSDGQPPPGSPPVEQFAGRASARQSPQSSQTGMNVIGNMYDVASRRGISSVVDVREPSDALDLPMLQDPRNSQRQHNIEDGYGACDTNEDGNGSDSMFQSMKRKGSGLNSTYDAAKNASFLDQIPAIAIISLLNLMMAIPFGVTYFPIGWNSGGGVDESGGEDTGGVSGTFPLPNKEALGIRMCLFSTLIGQVVMTFASKFTSAVAFQMIENLPFFHSLAITAISNQGYGEDALSTLFFLYGLSTVLVGIVFYLLGRFDLGRVVYFFPNHVLVGCIGGIGVFIIIAAIEVTSNVKFDWDFRVLVDNYHLLGVVLLFEGILRVLMWITRGCVPLLAPIYFCAVPFLFYGSLYLLQINIADAEDAGYFFAPPADEEGAAEKDIIERVFNVHTFDLVRVINFQTISWRAVYESIGTMIALSAFSLIHVPINIPAFSISMNLETDMNAELIAHGYSNIAAGLVGGLPNYMTYSNSLLYAKSKGGGKLSSLLVAFFTFVLFLFGPEITTYIPRCMAGTLLLHIGLDLFVEGVVDSYGSYDNLEYAGIWFITITMTVQGMTGGLIAGVFAALSVYAAQSITHINPIREIMPATTLRSSVWARPAQEMAILNDDLTGRARILLVQLQGHLFFGNTTSMVDEVKKMLYACNGTDREPLIVILDFTLVVGLDSSAAHAVAKLNSAMHSRFKVAATVFVAGRSGFPCEYALSEALSRQHEDESGQDDDLEHLTSSLASIGNPVSRRNRVCDNLDEALIFAEDVLIARKNPSLLKRDLETVEPTGYLTPDEERRLAAQQLAFLFPRSDRVTNAVTLLFSYFEREEYTAGQVIWRQGADSDCAKLLVRGECVAWAATGSQQQTHTAERVPVGNLVGELGLVHGLHRLSTLECTSEKAVLYSLSLDSWKKIRNEHTYAALYFEEIVIRYLALRVQHVSNRVIESRCLPV